MASTIEGPGKTIVPANQFRSTFVYGNFANFDNSSSSIPARAFFQRDIGVGGNLFLGDGKTDASGAFLDSSSNIQFFLNKEIVNFPVTSLRFIKNLTSDVQQQINDLSNNIVNNGGQSTGSFTEIDFTSRINNISVNLFDKIQYLSNTTSNVQTQINSSNSNISAVQNKTTDISWTAGQINKTTISNQCETNTLTFSNTLNNVPAYQFSFLSGLSSNVQQQLDTRYSNMLYLYTISDNLSQKVTGVSWVDNKTTISNECETSTLTFSNTLNNISVTTFSYLSGLASNVQNQLNGITETINTTINNFITSTRDNLQNQINALNNNNPPGTVLAFAGSSSSLSGYLLCDGSVYNSANYSALYNAIGTIYGDGGSGTFRVPDYRAVFLRGAGQQNVRLNVIAGGGAIIFKGYTAPELGRTVVDQSEELITSSFVDNINTQVKQVVTGSSAYMGTFSYTNAISSLNFTTNNNGFHYGNQETHPVHASVQYFIKY